MNRITHAALLFALPLLATAQTWCPPGATWYYTDSSFVSATPGYRMLEYVQDTTIDGQSAQQMSNTWYRLIAGVLDPLVSFKFHTYQDDDVVHCKTELSQPWDTLYWFDAGIGDHWHFPHFTDSDPCDRLTVVDTGTVVISGNSFHFLDYDMDSAGVVVTRRVTERLGDSYAFWPQPQCGMNEVKRGLRCYSDSELGLISTGIVPECDFTTSIADPIEAITVGVYPLPGQDALTLVLPSGVHRLEVYDANGRMMRSLRVVNGAHLDASEWTTGQYLLRLPDLGRSVHWIKE